ncbi:MAG: hypothetical protein Fur0018_14420 [Anaerolineales bacterium]
MDGNHFALLAEAFRYPHPGLLERLENGLRDAAAGPGSPLLAEFVQRVAALALAEWEMLYTRTLDLSPLTAPYIGYQQWGENYQRGNFMAQLNAELARLGIDQDGELPDHLVPVLRYLAVAEAPLPKLLENLAPAVEKMYAALHKAEADNPYLLLFQAVLKETAALPRALAGG